MLEMFLTGVQVSSPGFPRQGKRRRTLPVDDSEGHKARPDGSSHLDREKGAGRELGVMSNFQVVDICTNTFCQRDGREMAAAQRLALTLDGLRGRDKAVTLEEHVGNRTVGNRVRTNKLPAADSSAACGGAK